MLGLDMLQSVQYITIKGKRFAVLSAEDWESLIEWLENLEDLQIANQAFTALRTAGGNREQLNWLKWDEVKGEL